MVMIESKGYKFEMDGYLKTNLDIIKDEAIPNKWDAVFIINGKEGAGKTTLATQMSLYLDLDFGLNGTEFNPPQFETLIDYCPDESSILWDEGITGAMSARHASQISQIIISKLTQIRKKRLKIFICFPYLYMLNKYFVSRCVASFYVYSKGFTGRGHFFAYNQEQTQYLYALMKEKYSMTPDTAYKKANKSFYGRFTEVFCLPEAEYDEKKDKARLTNTDEDNIWRARLVKLLKLCKGVIPQTEIARVWGVKQQTVSALNRPTYEKV